MHVNVRDQLVDDVVNKIKTWQKDNYHKSMMHLKEKKEFEDAFKKVFFSIGKFIDISNLELFLISRLKNLGVNY